MNALSIDVSVDDQELRLLRNGEPVRRWPISTAAKGVGFEEGSYRTPTGNFVISDKIGDGADAATIFRSRKPDGAWDGSQLDADLVLSRILWLGGTDPANANTKDRYIYIHGTNHIDDLGHPASCGCVRMSPEAVIELFDLVDIGTRIRIFPKTRPSGKLIFFDCDSTLSSIEGIDELARAGGDEVFRKVESLTNAAMNGEIPIHEVFPKRMEIIRPNRDLCDSVARKYIETETPGVRSFISQLKESGWTPVILSGGFAPLIEPLAKELGIRHIEAVPLYFSTEGEYSGYGSGFPTTRNGGKPEVIEAWKQAMLPERTIMVGDGISDMESKTAVDLFIGYGGVVEREPVRKGADLWITDFNAASPGALDAFEA
ncbi:phosphoserine phosphatase [Haloferula helveola]|uniref:phosphoserine phosphatase n=1 Tax=Haloferula helveola TaxID=490095 RepID=A0ABN6HF05_9BACT|nr:phosphoserine phosphatase [Haloferula helveola]